jgi:hypothetical protein
VSGADGASEAPRRRRTGAAGRSGSSRGDLQRLVAERARVLHEWYDPLERSERPILDVPVSDPLEGPLALPGGQRGVGPKAIAQRVVSRLIDWRVVPIALYVNAMREQLLAGATSDPERPGASEDAEDRSASGAPVRKTSKQPGRRRPSSGSTPRS